MVRRRLHSRSETDVAAEIIAGMLQGIPALI